MELYHEIIEGKIEGPTSLNVKEEMDQILAFATYEEVLKFIQKDPSLQKKSNQSAWVRLAIDLAKYEEVSKPDPQTLTRYLTEMQHDFAAYYGCGLEYQKKILKDFVDSRPSDKH